jgi:ferredoxin
MGPAEVASRGHTVQFVLRGGLVVALFAPTQDRRETMSQDAVYTHYVCTREEARRIVDHASRYWVSNCGCRESRGHCDRSRVDVCLMFREEAGSGGSGLKEVGREAVEDILRLAEDKHLVTRPFRDERNRAETVGICFCCDDCCDYFLHPGESHCDQGHLIESTDQGRCTGCGQCTEVCYFRARKMVGGELVLEQEACYGCGLCLDVCPEDCIEMVARP